MIKGVFNDVVDRLKAGNGAGASTLFSEARRQVFSDFFAALGGDLSGIANQLGTIRGISINATFAEVIVVRTTPEGPTGFPVHIAKDLDGIWRISGM